MSLPTGTRCDRAGEHYNGIAFCADRRALTQVRGYKEHQCRFIFRLADVDLGRLGHVFGLLRMPRMAEIKHAAEALKNFRPSPVNPDTVKVCARPSNNMSKKVIASNRSASIFSASNVVLHNST